MVVVDPFDEEDGVEDDGLEEDDDPFPAEPLLVSELGLELGLVEDDAPPLD